MKKINTRITKRFKFPGKTRIFSSEDVEFSRDLADHEDMEAQDRAKAADARQQHPPQA